MDTKAEVERILSCETAEVVVIELGEGGDEHRALDSGADIELRRAVFHAGTGTWSSGLWWSRLGRKRRAR